MNIWKKYHKYHKRGHILLNLKINLVKCIFKHVIRDNSHRKNTLEQENCNQNLVGNEFIAQCVQNDHVNYWTFQRLRISQIIKYWKH